MLSNYVVPGQKVELRTTKEKNEAAERNYVSRVFEVLSDDRLEITMPMEKTKLILLPVDGEYDVFFYTPGGVYQCTCRIIDRYKSNNVYILLLELISNLRKYQRREYYRFSCALNMEARELEEEEIAALDESKTFLVPGLPLKRSVIVDISGGGLRFVATQKYEEGSLIYCTYSLTVRGLNKQYDLVGKVLSVGELEKQPGMYEHRVQFINIEPAVREEIIRYIFEEERKNIKKEPKQELGQEPKQESS